MIAVEEALRLIQEEQNVITETETIATQEALGRVLSKSIQAPIALPSFRQSAMDGYALHMGTGLNYTVIGEQKAGDANPLILKQENASESLQEQQFQILPMWLSFKKK